MSGTSIPLVLADDFLCTLTGPITNITIWSSWYDDFPDTNAWFEIAIWENHPATNNAHSRPTNLLCVARYAPPDYRYFPYTTVPGSEWFYNPHPFFQFAMPAADQWIWQYDFPINKTLWSCQPTQEVGNVYWISVQYLPQQPPGFGGPFFGWKTSEFHFNDDAVWWDFGLVTNDWGELRYEFASLPANFESHPFEGQSMDLAFAVETDPGTTTATSTATSTTTTTSSTLTSTTSTSTTSSTTTTVTTTTTATAPGIDYGDAPTNYPTLIVHHGASHTVEDPYFGDIAGPGIGFPDTEADGQPDANALTSHGYCGCGILVLQESVTLTNANAGFYDVQTNWVPRSVNRWRVPQRNSNAFYRVRKANRY